MPKLLLVSLIHNRKHLLSEAIMSAVNQTLDKKYFRHLILDNNSVDGATQIAEMFDLKYPHISLIKMDTNLGQQKAFNHILYEWLPKNAPDVEYWANLDSDDTITTNALQEVYNTFISHPQIGAAYSGFNIIDGKGRLIVKNHPKARLVPNQFTPEGQKVLRKIFLAQNPCGHIRCFRVKCLLDVGGFNTNYTYATDYNVFGRMLEKYPVIKIDKALYNFRQHGDQVEGRQSPQQTQDWKDMQKEFKEMWTKTRLV